MAIPHFKLLAAAVLLVCCAFHNTDGLAVMSIDLGNEYTKVAIVKPGVPMEIVLNKESQRKSASVISMRDGDRLFSDPAMNTAVKFPAKAYWYLLSVVGKKMDHPHVKRYQEMFPYYKMKADPDTGTVIFEHDDGTFYTPEELLAMILEKARESAEAFAEQTIKDAVITVPVYFNQAERRALMRAAEMVGINVLQLMNDNSAVALNYGVFRRKEFNGTAQNYLFYDMGATSATASIVSYQVVKMKDRGFAENNPQVTIKGVGFDASLGGLEFQLRLRDHLAKLFNAQKKSKNDVTKNPRAMAKLLKEAGRLKKVLSANMDHFAQVESLLDDKDFRAKVTREEYEAICSDLFDRVAKPVEDALIASQMHIDEISEVILMGGGTRVPKVQEKLLAVTGKKELGKSINTDEAAAMGGVYQAAYLSKGYKVKRFGVKDAVIYPIQVEFEREVASEDETTKTTRTVKRVIFNRMNPFPQSKVMKFNKNFDDFSFDVMYGDLTFLPKDEQEAFGGQVLAKVTLAGVGDVYKKHSADAEFKGVKAHFRVDESGLLHLDLVDSVFEKMPPSPDAKEEESTLSKLGNTISNLFSSEKKEEKSEEKKEEPPKEGEPKAKDSDKKTEKSETPKEENVKKEESKKSEDYKDAKVELEDEKQDTKPETEEKGNRTTDGMKEEKKEDDPKKENATKPDTGKTDTNKTAEKEKEKPKLKPITIKEKLTHTMTVLDLTDPTDASIAASKKKVGDLKEKDELKRKKEKAVNDLESYIFTQRDNLYQSVYEECSTEDERTKLQAKLSELSDWHDEQGMDTTLEQYENKLKETKESFREITFRVSQRQERPRALDALKSMLNHSSFFLKSIKNLTTEEPIFTEVEVNTLDKLINETKDWRTKALKDIKKEPASSKPTVLVEDIAQKISSLDRESWLKTMETAQNKTDCSKPPVLVTLHIYNVTKMLDDKIRWFVQEFKIRMHRYEARIAERKKKVEAEKKRRLEELRAKRRREAEKRMNARMFDSDRRSNKPGEDSYDSGPRYRRRPRHPRDIYPRDKYDEIDHDVRVGAELPYENDYFEYEDEKLPKRASWKRQAGLHIPAGVKLDKSQREKLRWLFQDFNTRMVQHRGRAAGNRGAEGDKKPETPEGVKIETPEGVKIETPEGVKLETPEGVKVNIVTPEGDKTKKTDSETKEGETKEEPLELEGAEAPGKDKKAETPKDDTSSKETETKDETKPIDTPQTEKPPTEEKKRKGHDPGDL